MASFCSLRNQSASLLNMFAICYGWCILRSIALPLTLALMRIWNQNPNYSSANCLMSLVNETEPKAFKDHIFYGSIRFENSCDLDEYVRNQFNHNENTYLNYFFLVLTSSSVILILTEWREVFSIKFILTFVAGYVLSLLHHSYSHFGQDISFFVGNVMHHAETSRYVPESNASLVDTVPQGFTISIVMTVTWACIVRALLSILDAKISKNINWKSLYFCNVICGMLVAYKVKFFHPLAHKIATEDMRNSMPFSYENDAYLHVFGHHGNGDWLGPNRFFDPFFSVLMKTYAYLHNEVFKLHVMTAEHYLLAVFYDSLVSLLVVGIIWCILRCTASSLEIIERLFHCKNQDSVKSKYN